MPPLGQGNYLENTMPVNAVLAWCQIGILACCKNLVESRRVIVVIDYAAAADMMIPSGQRI